MVYGSGKPDKHVNNCAGEEQRPTEGGVQGLNTVQGETAAGGGPDELCEQSNEHYAAEGEQALSFDVGKKAPFQGWPETFTYIRCIHGIFGREITKYTVMYGVYIRLWPTVHSCRQRNGLVGGTANRNNVRSVP